MVSLLTPTDLGRDQLQRLLRDMYAVEWPSVYVDYSGGKYEASPRVGQVGLAMDFPAVIRRASTEPTASGNFKIDLPTVPTSAYRRVP